METAGVLHRRATSRAEREWPRMDPPNVLWFFGAFATAFASIAVIDKVPQSSRDVWELLVSLAFFAGYAVSAWFFLRWQWWIVGGLDAAVAVAMVPAIGYGFASLIGTFPKQPSFNPTSQFSWSVFLIGVATIVVGLIAFALTLFSFLFFTVTVAVSITAQFFLPLIDDHPSGDGRLITAIVVGAGLAAVGLLLDLAGRRRDAFWFHAIGLLNVAIALSYYATGIGGNPNRGWIPMILAGAFVLIVSAALLRATWAMYGVLGFYAPIFHWLSNGVNPSSTGYALILLAIGVSISMLGLALHRFGRTWLDRRAEPPAVPPGLPPEPTAG